MSVAIFAAFLPCLWASCVPRAERPAIRVVADGRMLRTDDPLGNVIPDFSACGYGSGAPIPDLPVVETLEPSGGEDGPRIQAALDRAARRPVNRHGWRGAVLLQRGVFHVADGLRLTADGVVLRGVGNRETDTVLVATGAQRRTLIDVAGAGRHREVPRSRRQVVDAYVPVGSDCLRIAEGGVFRAGDRVIVFRPCTENWVQALGMDRIPPRPDGGTVVQWTAGSQELRFDRVITSVSEDRLTFDAPLTCAVDERYGGGAVWKYEFPGRIRQVGVERLRCVSEFRGEFDEEHARNCVAIRAAEDVWVRDVAALHFVKSAVEVGPGARRVTVVGCDCLDPVSKLEGDRRYSFHLDGGELTLFERCHARHGRHDFVTGARVAGPSVFLDCTAEQVNSDSGPHERWAAGILYDGVRTDGDLNVRNRGNRGTGQGWAGANHVLWNCRAAAIINESPPTAANWAIGCVANRRAGNGHWESFGAPVQPLSLYRAQRSQRLGKRIDEP